MAALIYPKASRCVCLRHDDSSEVSEVPSAKMGQRVVGSWFVATRILEGNFRDECWAKGIKGTAGAGQEIQEE